MPAKADYPEGGLAGILVALVAITAACGFVAPWAAVPIGAVAAAVAVWGIGVVERLGIDDPIGTAWPACGARLFYTGDPYQPGVQALGLAAASSPSAPRSRWTGCGGFRWRSAPRWTGSIWPSPQPA